MYSKFGIHVLRGASRTKSMLTPDIPFFIFHSERSLKKNCASFFMYFVFFVEERRGRPLRLSLMSGKVFPWSPTSLPPIGETRWAPKCDPRLPGWRWSQLTWTWHASLMSGLWELLTRQSHSNERAPC